LREGPHTKFELTATNTARPDGRKHMHLDSLQIFITHTNT